jgi:hypothetical protein
LIRFARLKALRFWRVDKIGEFRIENAAAISQLRKSGVVALHA